MLLCCYILYVQKKIKVLPWIHNVMSKGHPQNGASVHFHSPEPPHHQTMPFETAVFLGRRAKQIEQVSDVGIAFQSNIIYTVQLSA